jgi:hypothetical protein
MTTEYYTDNVPQYVLNKHTTYENTVFNEHTALLSDIKTNDISQTIIESRGRLLIGMCMKDKTDSFIEGKYKKYYDKEEVDVASMPGNDDDRRNAAHARTWIRLINEAMTYFIKKYKADGSRAKIAVIDNITFDGKFIEESDEPIVDFTEDDKGL